MVDILNTLVTMTDENYGKIKTCKSCGYLSFLGKYACLNIQSEPTMDIVTGEYNFKYAAEMRVDESKCGPDGKWWGAIKRESKEPESKPEKKRKRWWIF